MPDHDDERDDTPAERDTDEPTLGDPDGDGDHDDFQVQPPG